MYVCVTIYMQERGCANYFFSPQLYKSICKETFRYREKSIFSPFNLAKIFLNWQLEVPKYWNSTSYLIIKREEQVQS